jgi:Protein of unknown function (DUF4232)
VRAVVRLASGGAAVAAFAATAALAVVLNRPATAPAALTTATRPPPVPVCTATVLAVSLADGTGASGGTGVSGSTGPSKSAGFSAGFSRGTAVSGVSAYTVDFTNTSGSACTLRGYPSVTAYDARPDGYRQVGNTADADSSVVVGRVLLRPRATAYSSVDVSPVVPGVACRPVTVTGLRVIPPGASRPQYLRVQLTTCSATGPRARASLHVRPVQPGTGIAVAGGTTSGSTAKAARHHRHGTPASPE